VGEFLKEKFPFCRHLAILTQAFLGDLGVEGLRMQRGKAMGGGHVWNEVVINGQKRIIEPTWAFYGNHNEVLAEPNSTLLYSPEMRPAQVK